MRIFICLQVTMLALLAVSLKAIAADQEEPKPVTIYSHPKPIAKVEPNGEVTYKDGVKPEDVVKTLYEEMVYASKQLQQQQSNCDDIIRRKDQEIAKLTPKPKKTKEPKDPKKDAASPTGSKEAVPEPALDKRQTPPPQ